MKKLTTIIAVITLLCAAPGCKKTPDVSSNVAPDAVSNTVLQDQVQGGTVMARHSNELDCDQVNLVSDIRGYHAKRTDPLLNNAWGIAFDESGALWIACNHTGSAVIYDKNGERLRKPVAIPLGEDPNGAAPTGVVYNDTQDFIIPANGQKSEFIFATEEGILSAWSSGSSSITVADRSATGAVYKGIALANDRGANFLYVTNFSAGKIDVYDHSFHLVSKPFSDLTIPPGYAPFNIANINGKLYVTYALQKPDHHDDQSGPGNGYVNIFNPDGSFVRRFASRGTLNSPWGITQADEGFGLAANSILIGNFGDGRINVYDASGAWRGQLQDKEHAIAIDGLWTIAFLPNDAKSGPSRLYFTAGPDEENHGLFGYLKKQ